MKKFYSISLLTASFLLASCGSVSDPSENNSQVSDDAAGSESNSPVSDTEVATSNPLLSPGRQQLVLGEPISFVDPMTGGTGTVTFNSFELKQTCFDTFEKTDLPPQDNGTPTGEIWVHYVGILESPESSSNEVFFPDGALVDSNENIAEAMWNTECAIGERSFSNPLMTVLPGEKRRIEHWREVHTNVEKFVLDPYEFILTPEESTF